MTTSTMLEFRVDARRRELAGLLLPWDTVARNSFADWVFRRGSLSWSADVSRVKLLRDHDPTRAVGKALELVDKPDGLYGAFQVARGEAGDEVLSLAAEGVLDGFSVGPRIERNGWELGRDRNVRVVTAARLVEVTVTAFPAYDDARVANFVAVGVVTPVVVPREPALVAAAFDADTRSGGGFVIGPPKRRGFYE